MYQNKPCQLFFKNLLLLNKQLLMATTQELQDFTQQVRRDILRMVHAVNSGHPGGSLGCAEFFTVLYQEVLKYSTNFKMD